MRCWYTRWQMSDALDRGELASLASRMARGHAAGCASCQAFGQALAQLHTRLSRDAHEAAVPAPVARRSPWRVAGPLAAGAAAVVAIAVGTGGGHQGPVADLPPSPQAPAALVRMRGLADRVSQAFANTPLDTELANLIHDGKRGLDAVLATGGLRRPQ
jgi:predicted anti-sigma-YlaC factor YlaD